MKYDLSVTEHRLHKRINRQARSALRRHGNLQTSGTEVGSALVYEYALGRMIGKPAAVPGLLMQYSDNWWYFATVSAGHDIVYEIDATYVLDIALDPIPDGAVILVEVEASDDDWSLGLTEPTIYEFAFGGSDARESATLTLSAIAYEAGLIDDVGAPTSHWRQIIEEGTVLRNGTAGR